MSQATSLHQERIQHWLDVLGYRPRGELRFQLLRDGRSGAFTYRIRSVGEALILKIVLAESPPEVVGRGVREVLFYSRLAGTIPLLLPEVVASYGPEEGATLDGLALLLKEYRSPQPVASWDPDQYEAVARQLARLHALYWGKAEKLARLEWLRQPNDDFSPLRESALSAWRALWAQERLVKVFDALVIDRIEKALDHLTSRLSAPTSSELPLTLCHGDAHHENLLVREDGAWVWTDWQEVGIGHGADDVSFFYQRAVAAGGKAVLTDMLCAYHKELEHQTGTTIHLEALQRRAALHELTTRLFHWPVYLEHAPESVIRVHVSRVTGLLSGLGFEL